MFVKYFQCFNSNLRDKNALSKFSEQVVNYVQYNSIKWTEMLYIYLQNVLFSFHKNIVQETESRVLEIIEILYCSSVS